MKFTLAYTLLFLYVIAAIVFWGYSLNKQNRQLFNLEKEKLELMRKQMPETEYQANYQKILQNKIRRNKQYWGEGSTFILIILLTAGIVYYAYYRQRALARLQQNFMLSVTHELKSPLAGIKLNLQTLEKRKLEEAIQQKLFQHTLTETDRLNDLCNNILVSTQLESKHQALYNEQIVLRDLIETLLTQLQSRYPNYTFQLDPEFPDFELEADRSLWQLLISNLLENARKYSEPQEPIQVRGEFRQDRFHLLICDQGKGIPDAEKEKIFEKFYRVGNENIRTSKGTGLGLYIVRKIVRLYKYDIQVRNNEPKGSIFEIVFA